MISLFCLSLSLPGGLLAFADAPVQVQTLDFQYKKDAQVRYLDLKTRYQAEHMGEITLADAASMADEADRQASVDAPMTVWRSQGGPAPNVFGVKIHIYSTSTEALLNVPFTTKLRVRLGDLRVNPEIQMTDYDRLERSSRWVTVDAHTVTVPALAPGEDALVDLIRFNLLDFLAKHPNQWPVEVEAQVTSPRMARTTQAIRLIPDHFVVPVLY